MSFTAACKFARANRFFFFFTHFESRTGENGALVSAEIERRRFIVARWGFLNATFIKRRLLPESNKPRPPSSKQESEEGLFIELPCKRIHASGGRLLFFSTPDMKAAKKQIH